MNAPAFLARTEPLLSWAQRTGHWHAKQKDGDSGACASEMRRAEQHLASLPAARLAELERMTIGVIVDEITPARLALLEREWSDTPA